MATLEYLEAVGKETSPNSAGFSLEGGRAISQYLLKDASASDLQQAITEIVGGTDVEVGDGRVQRTPPFAHPIFPWLYAESITNIVGIGPTGDNAAAEDELEVPTITEEYAEYSDWKFTVEFKARQYPISLDESISIQSGSWYDESGSPQSFDYPTEWDRYTDTDFVQKDDNNLSAKLGSLYFRTASGKPDSLQVPWSPAIWLPDMYFKVLWFGIPYRYITSSKSFLSKYLGKINQNEVTIAGQDFSPGQLLYTHFTPKKYTPPVQQESLFAPGIFAADKLCNVELTFLYTRRTISNEPGSAVPNKNYIRAGWNLIPWINDKLFYYCSGQDGSTELAPPFLSAPIEQMQGDPDA